MVQPTARNLVSEEAHNTPIGKVISQGRRVCLPILTRVPRLLCGTVNVLHQAVLVEHRLVTDRQTQTHSIVSRTKNVMTVHTTRTKALGSLQRL